MQVNVIVGRTPVSGVLPVLVEHGAANRHVEGTGSEHIYRKRSLCARFTQVVAASGTRVSGGHHICNAFRSSLLS